MGKERTALGKIKKDNEIASAAVAAAIAFDLVIQNEANTITKTEASTINSNIQDWIRADGPLSIDQRNTCSQLFLEAGDMLKRLSLPAALKSCLEERATLSNSLNELAKICQWSPYAANITNRNVVIGRLPANQVLQGADNGSRRKAGNIQGSTLAKNMIDLKGSVTKLVSNYVKSVDKFFKNMKGLSVHSELIRTKGGEKARPNFISDEEALALAADDMGGMANNNDIMYELEILEDKLNDILVDFGDALALRLRLRNNLNNGQGLTSSPTGSSIAIILPSTYDTNMRINGYGGADNAETEELFGYLASRHLLDPRIYITRDDDVDTSQLALRYAMPRSDRDRENVEYDEGYNADTD